MMASLQVLNWLLSKLQNHFESSCKINFLKLFFGPVASLTVCGIVAPSAPPTPLLRRLFSHHPPFSLQLFSWLGEPSEFFRSVAHFGSFKSHAPAKATILRRSSSWEPLWPRTSHYVFLVWPGHSGSHIWEWVRGDGVRVVGVVKVVVGLYIGIQTLYSG